VQPNPKTEKTRKLYKVYKAETTFAGLETLKGVSFPVTTRPVFRGVAMALSDDVAHDVAHGSATFVEATVSPTVALSVPAVLGGACDARDAGAKLRRAAFKLRGRAGVRRRCARVAAWRALPSGKPREPYARVKWVNDHYRRVEHQFF
jgi:hypothetical protein